MIAHDVKATRTLRSQLPTFVVVFVVSTVVALAVAVLVAGAVGATITATLVAQLSLIGAAVACVALTVATYLLFPRPLAEAWARTRIRQTRGALRHLGAGAVATPTP